MFDLMQVFTYLVLELPIQFKRSLSLTLPGDILKEDPFL